MQLDCYILHNGKLLVNSQDEVEGVAQLVPRLPGGKGGFGSMLRAIGAQIEKTTNREACRDLSGRRLRDINEEKRLKSWIEAEAKRKEEAAESKKRKLERLRAEPKHEFKDEKYEKERSCLTERVGSAVEEGFKAATTQGTKRSSSEGDNSSEEEKSEPSPPKKQKTTIHGFDDDFDSDVSVSSSEDEADVQPVKKAITA